MESNSANWQVPDFREDQFAEKKHAYCVLVFVINEGAKFHKQLARMQDLSKLVDIVVADGGSTDGSTDSASLQNFGVNTCLTKTGPGKLGAQMRMGFAWALQRGYEGVIVIDGNNKDSVEDIPKFISRLEQGYDHVQGSRFIPGGRHANTPWSRWLGLKLLHAPLIRLASGFRYTDTTNGFRGYSAKLLKDERIAIFRDVFVGYEVHYYLAVKAARLGFKCCELPVGRFYPAKGKTPTKISPIKGNLGVIARLIDVVTGKYDAPVKHH